MKSAEIYFVPSANSHGYVWRWRAADSKPSKAFDYYYECLQNAQQAGYSVQQESAHGDTAPNHAAGDQMK